MKKEKEIIIPKGKLHPKHDKCEDCFDLGKESENQAWLARKRCSICGTGMKPQPLTDTCASCFEDN